jgi:hypothetical protein
VLLLQLPLQQLQQMNHQPLLLQ